MVFVKAFIRTLISIALLFILYVTLDLGEIVGACCGPNPPKDAVGYCLLAGFSDTCLCAKIATFLLLLFLSGIGLSDLIRLRRGRRSDKPSDEEQRVTCAALGAALVDSNLVIANYRKFLGGGQTWEEMMSHLKMVGNAAEGVVGEGKKFHPEVQAAIEEVENFDFGEEGVQGTKLFWIALTDTDEAFWKEKARIEIERQQHFNEVIARKQTESRCAR